MMTPIVITQSNVPPPNYEEATKFPEYKPPDYSTVVENANIESTSNNPQVQSKTV